MKTVSILSRSDLVVDAVNTIPFGYYFSVFGVTFHNYAPKTLYSGHFLGIDLNKLALPIRIWNKVAKLFKARPKTSAINKSRGS